MRPLGVAVVSGVPVESEGLQLAHHVRVHKNARTDLRVPQRPREDVGVLHSPPDHHGEVASRQRRDLGKVDGDRIAVQPAPGAIGVLTAAAPPTKSAAVGKRKS